MADPVADFDGDDMGASVAAMEAFLKGPQAPDTAAASTDNQIQPQAEAEAPQEAQANAGEVAEAPASEDTAPDQTNAQAAPQPVKTDAAPQAPVEDQGAKAAREQLDKAVLFAKALLPQIEQKLMGEFADIKTMQDLNEVGRNDPDRYNRFILARSDMQDVIGRYQQLEKQSADATAAAAAASGPRIDWVAEKAKLEKEVPELADPVKGPILERQLVEYAKSRGISPAGKTAAEIAILHEAFKASTDKAAQAKALEDAKAKAKNAPAVQTPGTARPQNTKADKASEAFSRLQKTGSDRDAVDVFRSILN